VAVNVPTTWQHLSPRANEFDSRMFAAINDMLLDVRRESRLSNCFIVFFFKTNET